MNEKPEAWSQSKQDSGALFEQHRGAVQRYIQRLIRDPDLAEDLTQETFLRAHHQIHTLQNQAALSAWLYRIATHVSIDRLRQITRQQSLKVSSPDNGSEPAEARWEDTSAPRIDEAFERAEMSSCVQDFIEELNDDYRAVILLHDLEGLTNPEIASSLGCSLDTVKIRLHRARQKLRSALQKGCAFERDKRGVLVCDRKAAP